MIRVSGLPDGDSEEGTMIEFRVGNEVLRQELLALNVQGNGAAHVALREALAQLAVVNAIQLNVAAANRLRIELAAARRAARVAARAN
jgi:hypothetical protein